MSQEDDIDETETRDHEKNRSMCAKFKDFAKFALVNKQEFILMTPKSLQPLEKEHKLSNKIWGLL